MSEPGGPKQWAEQERLAQLNDLTIEAIYHDLLEALSPLWEGLPTLEARELKDRLWDSLLDAHDLGAYEMGNELGELLKERLPDIVDEAVKESVDSMTQEEGEQDA